MVLVTLTIGYMLLQNFTGMAVASGMGLDRLVGLLGGSVSLLGGHGTSIAWAPTFCPEARNSQRQRDRHRLCHSRVGDFLSHGRTHCALSHYPASTGTQGHRPSRTSE